MSSNNGNPSPYLCPQCNATFTVRGSLTRHLATASAHNPPSRFFCRVAGCPKATEGFTRSDELLTHTRRVHGVRPAANNQGGGGNPQAAPAPLAPMAPMAPGPAPPMLAPGPVPSLPGPAFAPVFGPAPGPPFAPAPGPSSASASALAAGSSTTASSSATANTNASTSSAPGQTPSAATTFTFAEMRVGLPTRTTMPTPGVLFFENGIAPRAASSLASIPPEARNAVLQRQVSELRRDGQYLMDRYQRGQQDDEEDEDEETDGENDE